MKEVKISHLLNSNLITFLKKVGAAPGPVGYPSEVFLSERDAATLKRNNRKKFRKEYRYASKKVIDISIGTAWLQLGPNTTLGKAIRPGYALIDVDTINAKEKSRTDVYTYKVTFVETPLTRWQKIKKFFDKHFVFRG